MNVEYKVSVLVAAYNAEKYLRECLDSLVEQSLHQVQIICIDDASTDGTLSVLKEYAARDERVTVLVQSSNQGQAKARNLGLAVATGEFVTFLDSDDWLGRDALEKAYAVTLEHPRTDAVLLEVLSCYENPVSRVPYAYRAEKRMYSGKEAMILSLDWRIHGIYMVRNSIHQAYPYDTSSRMYSDDNTTHLHFLHSREVRFSDGLYYYRQHPVSNTNKCCIRRFDYMDAGLNLKYLLLEEKLERNIIAIQENFRWMNIIGMYVYYLQNRKQFLPEERKEIIGKFNHHHKEIDAGLLRCKLKYKFGYIPFKRCFPLFRAEVWLYYYLRKLLGRSGLK